MAGGALLHVPTSSSSSDFRVGGGIHPTLADSDVRPGGALHVTPAGFPLGVSPGACYGFALTSVASTLLCSGQLGLQDPPSHRFA
jgi:hypothetical protein